MLTFKNVVLAVVVAVVVVMFLDPAGCALLGSTITSTSDRQLTLEVSPFSSQAESNNQVTVTNDFAALAEAFNRAIELLAQQVEENQRLLESSEPLAPAAGGIEGVMWPPTATPTPTTSPGEHASGQQGQSLGLLDSVLGAFGVRQSEESDGWSGGGGGGGGGGGFD